MKTKLIVWEKYYLDRTRACTGTYVGLNENYRPIFKDLHYIIDEYGKYFIDENGFCHFKRNNTFAPVL